MADPASAIQPQFYIDCDVCGEPMIGIVSKETRSAHDCCGGRNYGDSREDLKRIVEQRQ